MTFKEFLVEVDIVGPIQRFNSHFTGKNNQRKNIENAFNTVKKDIVNILSNLSNSRNTFLNKLNYAYGNSLRKFYQQNPFEDLGQPQAQQQTQQQTQQSYDWQNNPPVMPTWKNESVGGWLGAAAGGALAGPGGVVPGAVAGHYGTKAVNYMLPANMQLRTHMRLERVLLGHLKTLLYMLENAKDPQVRQISHGEFAGELSLLIQNLEMWQEYYKEGGAGELYGSGYGGRKFHQYYRK